MSTVNCIPPDIAQRYEIREWRNAAGILLTACPEEWEQIIHVLRNFSLYGSEFRRPGGSKTAMAGRIDGALYQNGWAERQFRTTVQVVDERPGHHFIYEAPTHKIDCHRGRVALEIEWSNKDPFFDRDLSNFRLLFDLRVIEVGVIITRSDELKGLYRAYGKRYTATSTWMSKLAPRLDGGGGGGCPVLVFGITNRCFIDDAGDGVNPYAHLPAFPVEEDLPADFED